MHKNILIVVGITILFLGLAIQPSIAVEPVTEIDIEPKDYLFQTIIDIANNPEVKELFEQYNYDLFKVDIDRSIYRKLLLRNPRLMFNTLISKPSMSIEYLNKCYNNGIAITNILGEGKLIEIIENVEITDRKLFDELNNIISEDDAYSSKLETLKELNRELNPVKSFEDNPIICYILFILIAVFLLPAGILGDIIYMIIDRVLISLILYSIQIILFIPLTISMLLFLGTFNCIDIFPYI